jgi:zinc transport system ATP-binding protein
VIAAAEAAPRSARREVLLEAKQLVVGFGRQGILPPIDLAIGRAQVWGVVGRNGSGKTTLFRTLLGLQAPVSGIVVRPSGATVAYVPQRHAFDPLVPARAKDLVIEGSEREWSFVKPLRDPDAKARIARAIEATQIEPLLRKRYRELSEGQKQRVLLARALAGGPDLLVLDEPTSAMDLVAEREVCKVLISLRQRFGLGILLVSHHMSLVASMADRLLFLDADDAIAVAGRVEEVMAHPVFAQRYGSVLNEPRMPLSLPPVARNSPDPGDAA